MTKIHFAALSLLSVMLTACASSDDDERYELIVEKVNIIQLADGAISKNQTIVIDDGKITKILDASDGRNLTGSRRVDGGNAFVIPGLWDMHAHIAYWGREYAFERFLENGVLGIREMGWELKEPIRIRSAIENGDMLGPKFLTVGPIVDGPTDNWPLRVTVSTKDEVKAVITKLADAKVDFIKVHAQLDKDVYYEIAREAQIAGIPFAGHVPDGVTAAEAAAAGQSSLEHLSMSWCGAEEWRDDATEPLQRCSNQDVQRDLTALLSHSVYSAPTLNVYYSDYQTFVVHESDYQSILDGKDPRTEANPDTPAATLEFWNLQNDVSQQYLPPEEQRLEIYADRFASAKRMVSYLYENGAAVMTASDTGYMAVYPGVSIHDELALFVDAGLSPREALIAATITPAKYAGVEDQLGAVIEGAVASFVLLEHNPLEDIDHSRTVKAIVLRGEYMDVDDIAAKVK